MKMYHGTSASVAIAARKDGLSPRGERSSNWDVESRSDLVYLTTAYAAYFANNADGDGLWGIVEVETTLLNKSLILPDEDALEQAFRNLEISPRTPKIVRDIATSIEDMTMEQRTYWFRNNLEEHANLASGSVKALGNCSYKGVIPPEAITRISVVDHKDIGEIGWLAVDPVISVANYAIAGAKYRAATKWLIGRELETNDWVDLAGLSFPLDYKEMVAAIEPLKAIKKKIKIFR